jgi:PAS domain S-box-containing protein
METAPDPLLFRSLFEALPLPSIAFLPDAPRFTLTAVSDAYLQLVDRAREQLVGRPVLESLPAPSQFGSSLPLAQMEEFLSSDLPAKGTSIHLVIENQPNSQRSWNLIRKPVLNQDGKTSLILLTLQPLPAKPGTDMPAFSNHPVLDSFQYAVPGLAIFSLSGSILECNPAFARIVGRPIEELRHTESSRLIHPEDRDRSEGDMRRLLTGESPAFVIEKRYVRPDGEAVWVRNSVSLLRDADRRPIQIVTISEDIGFPRMAEQALIRSEKLAVVGRLSASIMHELNNPLESVNNLLYLISHDEDIERVRAYAGLAEEEMKRVTEIATHTLRFYRQQSEPAPFQLTDLVDGVFALFEGRLRNSNIEVIKRYQEGTSQLVASSGELRQVLVNLIGNALDAIGSKGTLRIDVRTSADWAQSGIPGLRISICDTGSGIPKNMLKNIFEPFVSTKEDRGTGLGLWISKEIIRRHGGSLSVRSSTSGIHRGTIMSVFIPTNRAQSAVEQAA